MSDNPAASADITTRCCIAGGGPAGMMLGFLLARAGVDVVVLEKHADFLRDFRGDTVHPSTLQVMHELGLLEAFLKRPHQEARTIGARIRFRACRDRRFHASADTLQIHRADAAVGFPQFPGRVRRRFPPFHLMMKTRGDRPHRGKRPHGRAHGAQSAGTVKIRADLVIGSRWPALDPARMRGPRGDDLGAPMDVVWLRLPRHGNDPKARRSAMPAPAGCS